MQRTLGIWRAVKIYQNSTDILNPTDVTNPTDLTNLTNFLHVLLMRPKDIVSHSCNNRFVNNSQPHRLLMQWPYIWLVSAFDLAQVEPNPAWNAKQKESRNALWEQLDVRKQALVIINFWRLILITGLSHGSSCSRTWLLQCSGTYWSYDNTLCIAGTVWTLNWTRAYFWHGWASRTPNAWKNVVLL